MKTKLNKKIGVIILSVAMAVTMIATQLTVFADSTAETRMENNVKWLTATDTSQGEADAKIVLKKTFKSTKGAFPAEENFRFNFERVTAWYNDSVNTAHNGTEVLKTAIPMPKDTDVLKPSGDAIDGTNVTAQVGTQDDTYHYITSGKATDGSNGTPGTIESNDHSVVVNLGNYNNGSYTADDSTNTSTERTRATAFGITYKKAGYYIYKVKEVNDTFTGVNYDKDEYYIVVDVANKVDDEGNTIDGVFVHSITAWENIQEAELYTKGNNNNSTTISEGKDIATDDNSGDGKDKITEPDEPDKITLDFENDFNSHDIELKKNVKGTLGDRTKFFEFEIDLDKLAKGEYTIETSGNAEVVSSTASAATLNAEKTKLTVTANNTATKLTVKLKDDGKVTIKDLNVGATYQIKEAKSDHVPSYTVTSSSEESEYIYTQKTGAEAKADSGKDYYTDNKGTTKVDDVATLDDEDTVYLKEANAKAPIIARPSSDIDSDKDADRTKDTELQTAKETVDSSDELITVLYTNQRDITTETGIPMVVFPIVLVGLLALIGLAIYRRKKNMASVEEF